MSEFNEDELEAPSWMNEEFFTEVMKKSEQNDEILIKVFKITPASIKGDHYASIMFRAAVTYDTRKSKGNSKSLIIKTMPEVEGHKMDLVGESYVFETEISMYSETIPKFEAELRKIGDNTLFGAESLYFSLEPKKVIVFEDICPNGYEMLRDRECTIEEAKASLLKLAKWHAVSYKLAADGDTSITSYKESFLSFKNIEEVPFIKTGIENFIEKLETVDDLKEYVPRVRAIQKDLIKSCIASTKLAQEKGSQGIFALCHGDFHRKNMMFKYSSSGKFEDVLLLDYQLSYYGPVILDVLYSSYLMMDENLRKNHYDELIYYYATNFVDCLKKLNFQGETPKVSDFFVEILRHRHFEFFVLSSFLALWNASGSYDPNEIMTSNEARRKTYDSENFINEVRRILPRMLHRGYFE